MRPARVKELVARDVHRCSARAAEPFIAVNCTTIPAHLIEAELFGHTSGAFTGANRARNGFFALAGRGTIFLDEIGEATPEFQTKLLRVLQEREFWPVGAESSRKTAARIIVATNTDLERAIAEGTFRHDLYYRLRVAEIRVPPLRERMSDVPLLAAHFIEEAAREIGIPPPVLSQDALEALRKHTWPGNVRELQSCIMRSVISAQGGAIHDHHLEIGAAPNVGGDVPDAAAAPRPDEDGGSMRESRRRYRAPNDPAQERSNIINRLKETRGNKTLAAGLLGMKRRHLYRCLNRHRITEGEYSGETGDSD